MKHRGKIQKLIVWFALVAYLFLGILSPTAVMAITANFAGSHQVSVIADGSHQDMLFTHDHLKIHGHGHHDLPGHLHSPETQAAASIFDHHQHPHADHVVHLLKTPEQLSTHILPIPLEFQYIHSINLPMAVAIPESLFSKTLSIKAFPQPPPLQSKIHQLLSTIILLI